MWVNKYFKLVEKMGLKWAGEKKLGVKINSG